MTEVKTESKCACDAWPYIEMRAIKAGYMIKPMATQMILDAYVFTLCVYISSCICKRHGFFSLVGVHIGVPCTVTMSAHYSKPSTM